MLHYQGPINLATKPTTDEFVLNIIFAEVAVSACIVSFLPFILLANLNRPDFVTSDSGR
jgi:hypothetical protein